MSSKKIKYDANNPTLMYGYGGFKRTMYPHYLGLIGLHWLDRGGVDVSTNIRGGGEYGADWHQTVLKQNRHKVFEDFEAIAEDLIQRKINSPKHLGIWGGSNGGLLVAAAYTRRPELFNAVVCSVPLLDMQRYTKLGAGTSWIAEYGDPDVPEQWQYIKQYSPYHNLDKDKKYPKVFFKTSTTDNLVHPGHARKMAALMQEYGHDLYYYESSDGGHRSKNLEKSAYEIALMYAYLWEQLK